MRGGDQFAIGILVVLALWPMPAGGQGRGPSIVSATATLTILESTVHHVPGGTERRQPAVDGMNLGIGDRILTGSTGLALITFLDGSTVTVQPRSDVTVKRAEVGDREIGVITIWISLGTVWARVARLLEPKPVVSLESNEYTATAHDGLIGAQQNGDGTFVCWTTVGRVSVSGPGGRVLATITPGDKATMGRDGSATIEPFAVNRSVLEVRASAGVFPLLEVPSPTRVVGFVAPGLMVNQVFGSFSGLRDGRSVIQVPAGRHGPFTLVLEGRRRGPFTVDVVGRYRDELVYQRTLSGTIAEGERLAVDIVHELDPRSPDSDPRSIAVQGVRIGRLRPLAGPLPGRILISPREAPAPPAS
jgi:hypothetical protein